MSRTSESEVRDIYSAHADGTALSTSAVEFHIEGAEHVVDEYLGGENLGTDVLQRIEALVACHLIASGDPTEASFAEGDTQATFEAPSEIMQGLGETRFGRRALLLDSTGNLSNASAGDPSTAQFYGPT